jgi:hypothetical protein
MMEEELEDLLWQLGDFGASWRIWELWGQATEGPH